MEGSSGWTSGSAGDSSGEGISGGRSDPAGGSGETASDWGGGAEGSFFPQAVKAQKSAQSSSIQMIFFMLFSP
jgi:hypothetical protein